MKDSEKKLIFVVILVGVIIIGGLLIWRNSRKPDPGIDIAGTGDENVVVEKYVQTLDDGSKLNTSTELAKTKTVDGLVFTNMQLMETGGITQLLADVQNNSGAATTGYTRISIDILDENGGVITSSIGFLDPMDVGESVQLNFNVSADVANAYDFRVSK